MAARRRQGELPGMEQKRNPEIENAAELYHRDMSARVALSNKEKVSKAALIAAMKKHGLPSYRDSASAPPIMITLKPGKEGVKIDVLEAGETLVETFGKPEITKEKTKKLAAVPAEGEDTEPH